MNILEGIEEIHLSVGRENKSYKNPLSFVSANKLNLKIKILYSGSYK